MHRYNDNWDGVERNKRLTEAPVLAPDTAGSMFGYSKPQFEMKIRQLIQRMGFEKGITRTINKPNGNMVFYFAKKAKAQDFAITFQGMLRPFAKGKTTAQFVTLADMNTDEKKYATGAEALVELMFNVMKMEETENLFNVLFEEVENLDGADGLEEATQQVIGKYRFTPFTEGSIKGWTISIQGKGQVGYIEEPAKKNTKTTYSPYKVYRTKGATSPWELKMSALPGTETRIISDKEIRFAPRQLLKAVAMWMDKHGKVMMEEANLESQESQESQSLTEEALGMKYFTDMDDLAKDIVEYAKTLKGKKNIGGFTPEQAALHQIAGSLRQGHEQMLNFFDGLLYHLESIHRKSMSPSKHGNTEIMNDLSMVIRELKKYKK